MSAAQLVQSQHFTESMYNMETGQLETNQYSQLTLTARFPYGFGYSLQKTLTLYSKDGKFGYTIGKGEMPFPSLEAILRNHNKVQEWYRAEGSDTAHPFSEEHIALFLQAL